MADGTTITGVPLTDLTTNCTGPQAGTEIDADDVNAPLQAVCNGLKTIRDGSYTTSATVTCTGSYGFTSEVFCSATCQVFFQPGCKIESNVPLAQAGSYLVEGLSNTQPVVVCITQALPPEMLNGCAVKYTGSAGVSGESSFVANVTSYAPAPWATATAYMSPQDAMTSDGSITRHPVVVTSNGFNWVCEVSGVSVLAPPATGSPIGTTFVDFGVGVPIWRNVGTAGHGVLALVGSVGDGGSASTLAAVQTFGQVQVVPAHASTRVLNKWWNDGSIVIGTVGGAYPVSFWTAQGTGGSVPFGAKVGFSAAGQLVSNAVPQMCGWQIGADDVPDGASLQSVIVYFQPPGNGGSPGSHVGAPANLPGVFLLRTDVRLGVSIVTTPRALGSASLAYVSNADYEAYNSLTVGVTAYEPFDPGAVSAPFIQEHEVVSHERYRYDVLLLTEAGTNALSGTIVYGARVSYTAQFYSPP